MIIDLFNELKGKSTVYKRVVGGDGVEDKEESIRQYFHLEDDAKLKAELTQESPWDPCVHQGCNSFLHEVAQLSSYFFHFHASHHGSDICDCVASIDKKAVQRHSIGGQNWCLMEII